MKRCHAILFLGALIGAFLASNLTSALADGTKTHTLKLVHTSFGPDSVSRKAVEDLARRVTEGTEGRIQFQIFGIELGDYLEIHEMIIRGEVDMLLDPVATTFDPRWAALLFPFLVTDYRKASELFAPSSYINQLFKQWAEEDGMHWLGTWVQGFTGVSLNHVVTTPEEAKGVKLRCPPIGLARYTFQNLGFDVRVFAFKDVPLAINTGLVEGQAGGGPGQSWTLVRDINKCYIHYRDVLELWGFVANKASWNRLEPDDQALIQKVANEMMIRRFTLAEAEERGYMRRLAKHGLTVVDLKDSPEKLAAAVELGRKTWPKMEEIIGKKAMDGIREVLK